MESKKEGLIRLINGEPPEEVALQLDVSLAKVARWSAELKRHQEEDTVNQLLQLSSEALINLGREVSMTALPPAAVEEYTANVAKIVNGVEGLRRLEESLQTTALAANTKIAQMVRIAENVSEVSTLVDALCSLQTAFFAKGTQVNIQNNIGDSSYGAFLGDAPGPKNI